MLTMLFVDGVVKARLFAHVIIILLDLQSGGDTLRKIRAAAASTGTAIAKQVVLPYGDKSTSIMFLQLFVDGVVVIKARVFAPVIVVIEVDIRVPH